MIPPPRTSLAPAGVRRPIMDVRQTGERLTTTRAQRSMQPFQERSTSSDFELRDLLAIIRRQAIPIVIVVGVVMAAAAVHTFRKADVYEADVAILVDFNALDQARLSGSNAEATRTLENEIQLLQGEDIRRAAAEAAGRPI
ncbi:hypothetical protein B7486_72800, partial [cyanobacterium TDX16]